MLQVTLVLEREIAHVPCENMLLFVYGTNVNWRKYVGSVVVFIHVDEESISRAWGHNVRERKFPEYDCIAFIAFIAFFDKSL